jgi:hypothetical protein
MNEKVGGILTADSRRLPECLGDGRVQLQALACLLALSVGGDLALDPVGEGVPSETVEEVTSVLRHIESVKMQASEAHSCTRRWEGCWEESASTHLG